jgi:hypothetical protein
MNSRRLIGFALRPRTAPYHIVELGCSTANFGTDGRYVSGAGAVPAPVMALRSGNFQGTIFYCGQSFISVFCSLQYQKNRIESPKMVHKKILEATHEYHWNYPRLEKWRSNRVD